ncbi:EAL domain-containing protein [Candidatus Pantoea persica]|uniref:EAL domain-containing protein n=1 Tax=Candidatus Pantoea persica TaxID=2518128 RepID=UPI00215D6450|nr:EAL domain-containing protein [Candidatus Pantoea persica]MBA2816241.1 putative diguanylate phosphodiesterase [Candidatus Pantoea persica]
MITLNVNRDIIEGVLNNPAIQQRLIQWPLLRLEVSTYFTERYLPSDSALLQNLVARLSAPLWLDDFGVGSSTLSMLDSRVFEYVKTDRRFFWKYGESHAFDLMLNHLNDLSNGVIVQGVDMQKHREWVAGKPLAGFQGRQWRIKQITDCDKSNKGGKAANMLKKRNNKNISNVIFCNSALP